MGVCTCVVVEFICVVQVYTFNEVRFFDNFVSLKPLIRQHLSTFPSFPFHIINPHTYQQPHSRPHTISATYTYLSPHFLFATGLFARDLENNSVPMTRAELFASRLRNTSNVASTKLPKLVQERARSAVQAAKRTPATAAQLPAPPPEHNQFSFLKHWRKDKK